ncbi:MAG: hypothetical protein WCG27_01245 [Pseudomonadota bacterium]
MDSSKVKSYLAKKFKKGLWLIPFVLIQTCTTGAALKSTRGEMVKREAKFRLGSLLMAFLDYHEKYQTYTSDLQALAKEAQWKDEDKYDLLYTVAFVNQYPGEYSPSEKDKLDIHPERNTLAGCKIYRKMLEQSKQLNPGCTLNKVPVETLKKWCQDCVVGKDRYKAMAYAKLGNKWHVKTLDQDKNWQDLSFPEEK